MKIKREVTVWHGRTPLHVEVDALSLEDIAATATLCRDGPANFRAMELCRKIADGRVKGLPSAVYVMHAKDMPICKVGFAGNPAHRLSEVQVGSWAELEIAALVWIDRAPNEIEQLALNAAKQMRIHLRGEWITAEPQEATELVLKAARYRQATVYDSETWLSNWSIRLHALAEAKDRLTAIEKLKVRSDFTN